MCFKDISTYVIISVFMVKMVDSFNFQDRNMIECHRQGLQCSTSHSTCKFDLDKNNMTCFCSAEYTGQTCEEDRNECDIGSAPCTKRGVCHNSVGSFRCNCLPGWQGSHCQTSDGSGLSVCLIGYTGVNCTEDFDECTQWIENPCEHGSTCVNTAGNFICSCVTGWEGRICNKDINECNLTSGLCHNGGNCTNISGSYKCVCPYPYTGSACDEVSSTSAATASTCSIATTTTTAFGFNSKQDISDDGPKTKVALIAGSVAGGAVLLFGVLFGILVYSKCSRESGRTTRTN